MDLNSILGITGILISCLATYHIAVRQGVFRSARLKLYVAYNPDDEPRLGKQWGLVFGIPDRSSSFFTIEIPILIVGGREPIRNVWVQVCVPRGRHFTDYSASRQERPTSFKGDQDYRSYRTENYTYSEHLIPLLRQGDKFLLIDRVTYTSSALLGKVDAHESAQSYLADELTVTVRAENHPEVRLRLWLVAVRSQSRDELHHKVATDIGEELFKREGIRVLAYPPGSLAPIAPWEKRRLFLFQLGFNRSEGKHALDTGDDTRILDVVDVFPVKSTGPRISTSHQPPAAHV